MTSADRKKLAVLKRRRDYLFELIDGKIDGMEWNSYDVTEAMSLSWAIKIVENADTQGVLKTLR